MALDDRDYMRDRYRKRRGLDTSDTKWNSRKTRVERDEDVPLGSASWVGKDQGDWFTIKNPGYADRKPKNKPSPRPSRFVKGTPRRSRRDRSKGGLSVFILPLILCGYAVGMYNDAKVWNYLPDFGVSVPFPESGEFKVRRAYASAPTSPFTIITGDRKAVVQLLNQKSEPIFAVYVRENGSAHVRAPQGTWQLRLIEGHKWHGDEEFFGTNTVTEDAVKPMTFAGTGGRTIDLRRRLDGNLHTQTRWTDPTF